MVLIERILITENWYSNANGVLLVGNPWSHFPTVLPFASPFLSVLRVALSPQLLAFQPNSVHVHGYQFSFITRKKTFFTVRECPTSWLAKGTNAAGFERFCWKSGSVGTIVNE